MPGLAGRLSNSSRYSLGRSGVTRDHWVLSRNSLRKSDTTTTSVRQRGRPLLDPEALTCLIVLLFIDESRLQTQRLHKVLRNLSFHPPTRHWIVQSLLSILHRTAECCTPPAAREQKTADDAASDNSADAVTAQDSAPQTLVVMDNAGGSGSTLQRPVADQRTPNWLSMSLDAALGCRASVFQLQPASRAVGVGATSKRPNTAVTVHPQATPVVCRHVLDALISLSKSFPAHFLPQRDNKEKDGAADAKQGSSRNAQTNASPLDFWDLIVKLDYQSSGRKSKTLQRSSSGYGDDSAPTTFNSASMGQLMGM